MLRGAPRGARFDGGGVEGLNNLQLFEEGKGEAKLVSECFVSNTDVGEDIQLVGVVPALLGDEKSE